MTRVLIVDDQKSFRRQLRQLLTLAGLSVVGEAGDIPEGEQLARALQPDLAIVDITLPGINGVLGTPRLKAVAPAMRVILVSAYTDQACIYQVSAQEAGAETFLSKDELDIQLLTRWK